MKCHSQAVRKTASGRVEGKLHKWTQAKHSSGLGHASGLPMPPIRSEEVRVGVEVLSEPFLTSSPGPWLG